MLKNILEVRARLGEGPCWNQSEQLLYWVDIYNHRVHQYNPVTGANKYFDVGEVVGCLAPAGTNRLIMAQRRRLALIPLAKNSYAVIKQQTQTEQLILQLFILVGIQVELLIYTLKFAHRKHQDKVMSLPHSYTLMIQFLTKYIQMRLMSAKDSVQETMLKTEYLMMVAPKCYSNSLLLKMAM